MPIRQHRRKLFFAYPAGDGFAPEAYDVRTMKKTKIRPNFIAAWRKRRGLTLEQLAERTELTPGFLSRIENGGRGYSRRTADRLSLALMVEPWELLGRHPDDIGWKIVKLVDAMPPADKRRALEMIKILAGETPPDRERGP